MQLIKFFVVFVALVGRICLSKIMIEINKPNGFAKLEDAAIQTLTNCYANQDKTIVLLGNFPGNFIKRLSTYQTFSLILLDNRRKAENNFDNLNEIDLTRLHKTHVVVIIASYIGRFIELLIKYEFSEYENPMAFGLALGWSPINKYIGCDEKAQTFTMMQAFNVFNQLNINFMCRARTQEIMMYAFNPFTNQAPEPWRLVSSLRPWRHIFSGFVREYREDEGMCKNLYFDKTQDLSGLVIVLLHETGINQKIRNKVNEAKGLSNVSETNNLDNHQHMGKREKIADRIGVSFFAHFITYVNATQKIQWKKTNEKENQFGDKRLITRPKVMRGTAFPINLHAYPHGQQCRMLITQFRGNKSQLQKIYSVIDSYSWLGMYMVYLITLIFFKYFLRQSLIEGILNLCRLTCNSGLTTLPVNVASQIYLSCLLFFVVTMQGIFVGNLAALLTHDIPVRQVNSIKDLADLGHTVYAPKMDFVLFDDPVFKGRVIEKLPEEGCIPHVIRDPLIACLTWGGTSIDLAYESNLHVGTDCVVTDYITTRLPWKWPLKDRFNKFLSIMTAADSLRPFDGAVYEIRFNEAESEEIPLQPRIMTLRNLAFAFIFLGIGLVCAFISFIVEIMIHRYYHKPTTTRVIVLK